MLDSVYDLEIMRGFDLNGDGIVATNEFQTDPGFAAAYTAAGAGAATAPFVGLKIGLVTFSKSPDGLLIKPPALFANRNLSGVPATPARRYRSSFIIAAARNR